MLRTMLMKAGLFTGVFLMISCGDTTSDPHTSSDEREAEQSELVPPNQTPSSTAEPNQCPLVPMEFRAAALDNDIVYGSIEADGTVSLLVYRSVPLFFDSRGCIHAESNVWTEWNGTSMWTRHQTFPLEPGQLDPRRELREDGTVYEDGILIGRFTGYRPEAECAARLLYSAILVSTPNRSDDLHDELSPPSNSVCPDRHIQP